MALSRGRRAIGRILAARAVKEIKAQESAIDVESEPRLSKSGGREGST
jgi:hypothetical protein